ncbi:Uncharacterised protein [Cardiobacterium valvarum]|uniref:Uncharacterized protein n=1 Tax=Cardiobacterium valvarum TaxID=194702 RepID=A0A381E0A5_9GAMM|nr:Uncharacterised protein [Cardiobacterium valvarum]
MRVRRCVCHIPCDVSCKRSFLSLRKHHANHHFSMIHQLIIHRFPMYSHNLGYSDANFRRSFKAVCAGALPSGWLRGFVTSRFVCCPHPNPSAGYPQKRSRFCGKRPVGEGLFCRVRRACAKVIGIHTVCAPLPCPPHRAICPRGAAVAGRRRCSRSGLRRVVLPPALFLVRL